MCINNVVGSNIERVRTVQDKVERPRRLGRGSRDSRGARLTIDDLGKAKSFISTRCYQDYRYMQMRASSKLTLILDCYVATSS